MSEVSTPTIHPNDDDKRPFEPTKTKFGIIQREIERMGLPSHSNNISSTHALAHNVHGGDLMSVNLKIETTESILGTDVSVETDVSVFKISEDQLNSDKNNPVGADVEFGSAVTTAHVGIGLTGTGAQAGAEFDLVSANIGPLSATIGIGVSTGAFVSPLQASTTILGTGISFGEKTSISILGSSVTLNVGEVIEETTNHFVHGKNPHEIISKKIHHIEHQLGVDITVNAVETRLGPTVNSVETRLDPLKMEVQEIISVVGVPIETEFREHVVVPVRRLVGDKSEKRENT